MVVPTGHPRPEPQRRAYGSHRLRAAIAHSTFVCGGWVKPPFCYFGGKVGMAEAIVALLPPHRVYLEPYFGSGAVLFSKPRSRFEIVNDLDDAVVTFWRVLRQRPAELEAVCALTPHARGEYRAAALDAEGIDELERARRWWVRVNQSFAKTANDSTGWSVTVARGQSAPASIRARLGRFAAVAERLADVSIESCDAAELIERLATSADTVVYADPPYLAETRSTRTSRAGDYRRDMATAEAHERLAAVLNATPAKVVLSGYPSALYDSLYRGWTVTDRAVTMFSSNATTASRPARVERLWLNFEPTRAQPSLFDHHEAVAVARPCVETTER